MKAISKNILKKYDFIFFDNDYDYGNQNKIKCSLRIFFKNDFCVSPLCFIMIVFSIIFF